MAISALSMDRRAAVLNKLQNIIQHADPKLAAKRRLAIERWVKTYIRNVEYLNEDKLKFLYDVFQDESCWSGPRLVNQTLGQRLAEERNREMDNPLRRYDMACRYCATDKIPLLFRRQFESFKSTFPPDELDDRGDPAANNDRYLMAELLDNMESEDPVFAFWIDKESGELKHCDDPTDGFSRALELEWSEGVEYFYDLLMSEAEREARIIDAVLAFSSARCNHNGAIILDFCVGKMSDRAKNELFKRPKLLKQTDQVMWLLSHLIHHNFFDTVQALLPIFKGEVLENKILSPRKYTLLLAGLSDKMFENAALSSQVREIIMDLVKCGNFTSDKEKKEKTAVFICDRTTTPICYVVAALIIEWKLPNEADSTMKKRQILEIMQFAKEFCSTTDFINFRQSIISTLKSVSRNNLYKAMNKNIDYSKIAESLFIELDDEP